MQFFPWNYTVLVMCSQAILRHDNSTMLGDFTLEYHYELEQIAIPSGELT